MKNMLLLVLLAFAWGQLQAQKAQPRIVSLGFAISNVYLIESGGTRLLVDAGLHSNAERLEKKMRRKGIDPRSIDYLMVTHGHADHAGAAGHFQEKFGTKVIGGAADTALFHHGHDDSLVPTSKLAVWVSKHIATEHEYPPFRPDILVKDRFDLGKIGMQGEIRLLPGHTGGSLVLVMGEEAFVGDLIRGALLAAHLPRRHFYHADTGQAESHLAPLLDEGVATFYTGHRGTLKAKRIRKYLDRAEPGPEPSIELSTITPSN